jgi:hypothetical protein
MKLFPRNLTARADTVVRGNPVTTRPESGVDNSWPGLEFDHRGMEKFFFPGLVVEFPDERATMLREFAPKSAAAKFFKQSDIQKGSYLAFLQGPVVDRSRDPVAEQRVFSFIPPAALENWRVVRDLEPGRIGIALVSRTSMTNYAECMSHRPTRWFGAHEPAQGRATLAARDLSPMAVDQADPPGVAGAFACNATSPIVAFFGRRTGPILLATAQRFIFQRLTAGTPAQTDRWSWDNGDWDWRISWACRCDPYSGN